MLFDNRLLSEKGERPSALIILNGGSGLTKSFPHLWTSASVTVCADGGANCLFDDADRCIPMYIKGDCDSIRSDVLHYYKECGTQVLVDQGQDTNDLDKCLQLVSQLQSEFGGTFDVLVVGAMGGRFDQEMQNINALYRWTSFGRIILLSDTTSVFLVPAGHHVIRPNFDVEQRLCGLIPLGTKCNSITTQGLRWDLNGQSMSMGSLVSSSNQVLSDSVRIQTSDPILWTSAL